MPELNTILHLTHTLMVLSVLAVIAYRDYRTHEIPDLFNLLLLALGLASLAIYTAPSIANRLLATTVIAAPMLLLATARPGSIGGGDIKLMAAAGILLGLPRVAQAAAIGIITAAAYAATLLATGKATPKNHIAFGPPLCLGIATAQLFGDKIMAMWQ